MTMQKLSPSAILTYETCGKQYQYKYAMRMDDPYTGHSLIFGKAIDHAIEAVLYDLLGGGNGDLAVDAFNAEFTRLTEAEAIQWGSRFSESELRDIGTKLMKAFPASWKATGFTACVGLDGKLLTQRKLRFALPDQVVVTVIPDLIATDRAGLTWAIDMKTAAQLSAEGFADLSDQLTCQQIVIDAHLKELGLKHPVAGVAFFEGVKQKTNPGWHLSKGKRREPHVVQQYLQKAKHVAKEVRDGYFPTRSAMAFNTPCGLCAFAKACKAEREGQVQEATSRLMAAA
ncbi:MAG: PD-(D/E)XK nuclease family protein [Rhodanobacter sp.]